MTLTLTDLVGAADLVGAEALDLCAGRLFGVVKTPT